MRGRQMRGRRMRRTGGLRRAITILLAAAMVITMVPQNTLAVSAAEPGTVEETAAETADETAETAETAEAVETMPEESGETSDKETTDEKTPGGETTDEETPGGEISDEETPGGEISDEETPGGEISDEETPGGEISDEETPDEDISDGIPEETGDDETEEDPVSKKTLAGETYEETKTNLAKAVISLTLDDVEYTTKAFKVNYTGTELKPAVKVTVDETTLTEGTDYTVAYKRGSDTTTDFINQGTVKVTVTAADSSAEYTGSVTISYVILPLNISKLGADDVILSQDSLTYTGEELKPALTGITVDGKTVTLQESDYALTYANNINVQTVVKGQVNEPTVTVKGMSTNVRGSVRKPFEIVKAAAPARVETTVKVDTGGETVKVDLSEIDGIFEPEKYGTPAYADYWAVTDTNAESLILNDTIKVTDGVLSFDTGTGSAGSTAYITVNAEFVNYETSSVQINVSRVAKTSLADAEVELTTDGENITEDGVVYTGTEIKPEAVVKVKTTENSDLTTVDNSAYEVAYSGDLTNAGTVTVTVTAKANSDYKGSAEKAFKITQLDLASVNVTLDKESYAYTGEELKPVLSKVTVDDKEVALQESDYELTYANNVNVPAEDAQGTAAPAVTVTAKSGNVTGSVSQTFTIVKAAAPALKKAAPAFHAKKDAAEEFEVVLADYFETPAGEEPEYTVTVSDANSVLASAYAGNSGDGNYKLADGVLGFKTTASGTAGDSASMEVEASYKNYENRTMDVTVTLEEKIWLTITGVSISDKTYDGEPAEADISAVAVKDNKGNDPEGEVQLTCMYTQAAAGSVASVTPPDDAGGYKLTVSVSEENGTYTGSVEIPFTIAKAAVTVTASDVTIEAGGAVPDTKDLKYAVTGLVKEETLSTPPVLEYRKDGATVEKKAIDNTTPATYDIVAGSAAFDADTAKNYEEIQYEPGILTIKQINGYEVTFVPNYVSDGLTEPAKVKVNAGALIAGDKIPELKRDGYVFRGWYKDAACTKAWNFETETVQADMALYALWISKAAADDAEGVSLMIQDIPDQIYTGSAVKPAVKVYDGDTLLTAKNYTITYKNNINADVTDAQGGISDTDKASVENGFNKDLPYIVIKGKGNYNEAIYMNFHIKKASLEDSGFTLKYNDQLTVSAKTQKPVSSLKYKKAMKEGVDYIVAVSGGCVSGEEEEDFEVTTATTVKGKKTEVTAALIPANAVGTVALTITGIGNYTGTMQKEIKIANKAELLKNAKISLGSSSRAFTGEEIIFDAAYVSGKKTYSAAAGEELDSNARKTAYTVTLDKKPLIEGRDFTAAYTDNINVGTATLTITGCEDGSGDAVYCAGTKSITFKITGAKFTAADPKNPKPGTIRVEGLEESVSYTGFPQVQNDVVLSVVPAEGEDPEELTYGEDYTITYKNNVKKGKAAMTFTATPESGFTGSFRKTFKIDAVDLKDAVGEAKAEIPAYTSIGFADGSAQEVTTVQKGGEEAITLSGENGAFTGIIITDCAYSSAGVAPAVKLWNTDGTLLQEKTDYTVKYSNNKKVAGSGSAKAPTVTIKGKGGYKGSLTIRYSIINNNIEGLKAEVAPVQFKADGKDSTQYKPKVKATCDGKALDSKEYAVIYSNNTQDKVEAYLEAKKSQSSDSGASLPAAPAAAIVINETSSYYQTGESWTKAQIEKANTIEVNLGNYFYDTKLSSKNVKVYFDQSPAATTYTGGQVTPEVVRVVYNGETDLKKGDDYTVSYGENNTAGQNKGSVTIKGIGFYSGSVTVKFTILSKAVYNKKPDL